MPSNPTSPDWKGVEVKRSLVPEWLWWLACVHVPVLSFKQLITIHPVRRWLAVEVKDDAE